MGGHLSKPQQTHGRKIKQKENELGTKSCQSCGDNAMVPGLLRLVLGVAQSFLHSRFEVIMDIDNV